MKLGKKKLKLFGRTAEPEGLRSGLHSAFRAPLRPPLRLSGPAGRPKSFNLFFYRVLRENRIFFLDHFSETRTKNGAFTSQFGVELETYGGYIETGGFWLSLAEGQISTKTPGFNEYHHRFSRSYFKARGEYRHFF